MSCFKLKVVVHFLKTTTALQAVNFRDFWETGPHSGRVGLLLFCAYYLTPLELAIEHFKFSVGKSFLMHVAMSRSCC